VSATAHHIKEQHHSTKLPQSEGRGCSANYDKYISLDRPAYLISTCKRYVHICIQLISIICKKHLGKGGEPLKYAGFVHIQVCYVRALARKNLGIWGSKHNLSSEMGHLTQKHAPKKMLLRRSLISVVQDFAFAFASEHLGN
jgi:hypothetical protein